jgi:hypothetical protein
MYYVERLECLDHNCKTHRELVFFCFAHAIGCADSVFTDSPPSEGQAANILSADGLHFQRRWTPSGDPFPSGFNARSPKPNWLRSS